MREITAEEQEAMVARLADLMEAGFRLVDQQEMYHTTGVYFHPANGFYRYCALGMACLGVRGILPKQIITQEERDEFTEVSLERAKIDLGVPISTKPESGEAYQYRYRPDLGNAIVEVNDSLGWKMTRIIKWLRSLRWDSEEKHFFTPKEEGGTQA